MMTYQPQPSVCPNAHTDIVSRLEAATGPDRQIDVLVAMLFNPNSGLTYEDYGDGTFSFSSDAEVPAYTASLDASLALVGEKLPGWTWRAGNLMGSGGPQMQAFCILGASKTEHYGATPALAVLLAIFRALKANAAG